MNREFSQGVGPQLVRRPNGVYKCFVVQGAAWESLGCPISLQEEKDRRLFISYTRGVCLELCWDYQRMCHEPRKHVGYTSFVNNSLYNLSIFASFWGTHARSEVSEFGQADIL